MRTYAGWFACAALLGAAVGFSAGRSIPTADAQTVDNRTTRWLAGTMTMAAGQDAFVLFDSQTNRLAAYTIGGARELELLAVREVSYDMKLVSFGKQKPPIQEIRDQWEKNEKERREREKPPGPEPGK